MELQTFVAITCHAAASAELRLGPIFRLIRVCLAGSALLYQCDQPFLPAWFQHLSLISGAEGWNEGHAGFRAYLFTLRASSIVPPPASFEGFFTFLCSLLFWEQVTGPAHGSLLNLLGLSRNSFLQHISSLSYTPEIFLQR